MAAKFEYSRIEGVQGNANVTPEFIDAVEKMAERLGTKPEYLLAAMSFETGGRFDPGVRNGIGATGLIQFLRSTALNLGTTTEKLARMSAVAQLVFVEKYFEPFKGRLGTLEAVYTSVLSGSPKKPEAVLFKAGTSAYRLNPLDWNDDGIITAAEATTPVAARMFGGVRAVQQRLLEVGVVPAANKVGFVDGRWGGGTTKALAAFQKKNGLEETGLMDEASGLALFPTDLVAATTSASATATTTTPITAEGVTVGIALERGAPSEAVGLLQDALVALGYMTLDQIGNFHGTYGPKTEAAVKTFQQHLGLKATGTFGEVERKALEDIQKGVAKGDPNTQLVKAIQTRLVELTLLTQKQVNTGFGTYGGQTETAVKQFQSANKLSASGVVEVKTFRSLFNHIESDTPSSAGVFVARDGEHFVVASGILMTETLQAQVANLANHYFALTGNGLIVTSGYRPPDRQSKAMYDKITLEGETSVRKIYRNKPLIDEILNVYRRNKGNPPVAIAEMQRTIEAQMKRGKFISNHLLSDAIDLRKATTNLTSLRTAITQAGARRVVVEGNHYHVEL